MPLMKRLKLYWKAVPGDPVIVPLNIIDAGQLPLYDGIAAASSAPVTPADAGSGVTASRIAPNIAVARYAANRNMKDLPKWLARHAFVLERRIAMNSPASSGPVTYRFKSAATSWIEPRHTGGTADS